VISGYVFIIETLYVLEYLPYIM